MSKATSLFDVDRNLPQNKSVLFELMNPAPLDPSKETMAVITFNNFQTKFYDHIYGFSKEVIDVLRERYNLIFIGKEPEKDVKFIENVYRLNQAGYNKLNGHDLHRKKEDPNSTEHNNEILEREFKLAFGDIKIDRVLYTSTEYFVLPFTVYFKDEYAELKNEFHDYVGTDEDKVKEVNGMIEDFTERYNDKVSLLAFTMYTKNIFMNLPLWMNRQSPLKMIYTMTIDPASFVKSFDHYKIPTSHFYFANDKRGTRKFEEFPISHIQHLLHENRDYYVDPEKFKEKTNEFFFMGSILQDKGGRKDLWYKYLNDLNIEKSKMWVPIKLNGIFLNKSKVTSKYGKESVEKAETKYAELVSDIKNHKMWQGHIFPDAIKSIITSYKYSLILRCVSFKDSLNYRPVQYAYMRILPFLDPMYDPEFLQIPEHIQKRLCVSDSYELKSSIKYYNKHPEQREELLDELYEHFKIDEFLADPAKKILTYFEN